jgi:hypothetical protein
MNFNDLLHAKNIDPKQVLVLRHSPEEANLRKVLPWLAAERPELFNAYQQTQGEKVEKAMKRASHVASFIGHEPRKAIFVGLYSIGETEYLTRENFWHVPAYAELQGFGMSAFTKDTRTSVLFFHLALMEFYSSWKGKLIVDWPSPEVSWWRWAGQNTLPIRAILEDSALDSAMPDWKEIVLRWEELAILPTRWKHKLSEWRGIYFILDSSDGKSYVGSAYGDSNLLGRWLNYGATGHGGNSSLRNRDPKNFRFTILQRVSPDMKAEEVIRLEESWKLRLHTRSPRGLNEN